MKAIVCHQHGGPEVMQYEEVPRPEPGAGQLLIRAEAIGVNYVDTMRRSGRHPSAPQVPYIPGIEVCGHVVSLGADVSGFREKDRVIARCVTHGAYAEHVCAEARFAVLCPASVSAEAGAAILVTGQTAYHALFTLGRLRSGETVLITAAAGGVGTWAVQLAKLRGARVVAAASTPEKRTVATESEADVVVDYSQKEWPEEVLAATEGRGADLILESVGGDVFQGCLRCWALRGRLVVYGKASGQAGVVTGDELLFGHRTVYGLAVGMVIEDTDLLRSSMQQIFDWVAEGRLRVLVGRRFPLSEAAAAHQLIEGRQSHGKVILLPPG